MFVLTASAAFNNQQTVDTYLAKGNGPSEVLVETMQGVTAHTSGENITAPGGGTYIPRNTDLTMEERLKFSHSDSY